MPYPRLDRRDVRMKPLAARPNKKNIERDAVHPGQTPRELPAASLAVIEQAAEHIRQARRRHAPVMLTFGAHAIKNGLAPVLIKLLEEDWLTHLATNGAGIIHDWEFAYLGQSSEDVRANVARGEFGNWEETGRWLNLALAVGAYENRGYGESVGAMIHHQRLTIPAADALRSIALAALDDDPGRAAAALDLLDLVKRFDLPAGDLAIPHPHRAFSVQQAAFARGVPFTGHPMIGHDIIYNHPLNHGGALGRAALRDFLTFAESVSRIDGGVYLSIGSAVMSPMIFEKSFSMAQNLALQEGRRIENHTIFVVDLAESRWDWSRGEPPENSPDYYLRFNKTFARMGGRLFYLQADNRDFLLWLTRYLGL